MLNIRKALSLLPITLLTIPILTSCGGNQESQDGTIYLKVLNSEDYIYKYDAKEAAKPEGNKNPDMTVQFENHMKKDFNMNVKVIYDTFDTMENMYNTLKTGKTKYDLICASEYMIQKLAREKVNNEPLIQKLDQSAISNYYNDSYEYGTYSAASPFIREKLQSIPAIAGQEAKSGETLDDYAMCYMWGTLGILYNPQYKVFKERGIDEDTIHSEMSKWETLWDSKYNKTISIKDSMRDTYAIGVMHSYKNELDNASSFDDRNRIFNYGGEADSNAKEHINTVKNDLLTLRNNVFGFEVDSGKQDIVTGKIGIDTAWSGDAVYSMDQGDEEEAATLYYSIPTEGTNLWFDCWAMQYSCSGENKIVANEFLNFISDPDNAIQNMDYIGYTSPIAGEGTFNYFKKVYDDPKGENPQKYDVSYFYNKKGETTEEKYFFTIPESEMHRQIAAQFPSSDVQDKLMIMQDYGTNNDLILSMWEQVKHESLPGWAIGLLSTEGAVVVAGITIFVVFKVKDKNRRKKRKTAYAK